MLCKRINGDYGVKALLSHLGCDYKVRTYIPPRLYHKLIFPFYLDRRSSEDAVRVVVSCFSRGTSMSLALLRHEHSSREDIGQKSGVSVVSAPAAWPIAFNLFYFEAIHFPGSSLVHFLHRCIYYLPFSMVIYNDEYLESLTSLNIRQLVNRGPLHIPNQHPRILVSTKPLLSSAMHTSHVDNTSPLNFVALLPPNIKQPRFKAVYAYLLEPTISYEIQPDDNIQLSCVLDRRYPWGPEGIRGHRGPRGQACRRG
jgi:hypothetical protein